MTTSDWKLRGRCVGVQPPDADLFFSEDYRDQRRAKREYCAWCPVTKECLDYALRTETWVGVWGGMTEDEREKYDRQRRRRGLA